MMFSYKGVAFGGYNGELLVEGFEPGAAELRSNTAPRAGHDGTVAGPEYLGSATWAFELATNRRSLAAARETAAALTSKWLDPADRTVANTNTFLRYQLGPDEPWRRVYGRPGPITPIKGNVHAKLGVGKMVADFKVHDPRFYADAEQSAKLTIVPATTGGFKPPFVFPLSTVRSSAARAGYITNAGDADTPAKVVFHGPVSNPWIRAATGWEIGLIGTLAYDETVTIDARAGTVLRGSKPAAGMLTRKTRLSRAVIPRGVSELTFGGTDATGTATATVYWRDAYTTI